MVQTYMSQKLSYCGQLVKEHDPDRFLLSMFAPADCREALWALFAFNFEIARTREAVSEVRLGLIRLQWWREAIDRIYKAKEMPEHEVLTPLAATIRSYNLPHEHFETLINAREFDLDDELPANLEGLVNYADFTSTPLIKLAVQIAGGSPETEPVQPIATAYALAGILRSAAFHALHRRCYLPEDLLKANGVSLNKLYEGSPGEGLFQVVRAVNEEIVLDAVSQSSILKALQKLTKIYAGRIQALEYDVFHPKIALEPNFKVLRVIFSVM